VADVATLESKIKSLQDAIKSRSSGGSFSRRGVDGLMPLGGSDYLIKVTEQKIENAKAAGDQAALENEQRIYRNLISERLAQERAIAERQTELEQLQKDLETAKAQQAQQDSAKGQTADSQVQNNASTQQSGTPLTEQEKKNLANDKSGQTASTVNQTQDPTATSKQNTQSVTGKSEASFSNDTAQTNAGSSVISAGASGNPSSQSVGAQKTPVNKLHDYTSYTYRITLFFLTSKDFNDLTANPSGFEPRYSLISSSGGYATTIGDLVAQETRTGQSANYSQTLRHPDFQTDFFIDNLSMETVVGLNAKNKASNAIEINFTITEPYGLSLLDRLLSACETSEDRNPNYATQPYLLQIDLLASPTDDMLFSQVNVKDNLIDRKRMAIKLLEMKIKPTASGSTYACRAIPFNHSAFDETTAPVPVPLNVVAKTVGDFFSNTDDQAQMFTGELKANEERLEAEIEKWIKSQNTRRDDTYYGFRTPTAAEIAEQRKSIAKALIYNAGSFTAAYNRYMEEVATKAKITLFPPTKISFTMPKEIATSNIVDQLAQSSDSQFGDRNKGVGNTADPDFKNKLTFPINAGTNVIEVIDQVLGKSDYIKNQINTKNKVENDAEAKDEYANQGERAVDKPSAKNIKWYKIIPTVELKDFDMVRNNYSKTVNYAIVPYTTANAYHPNFPKTRGTDVASQVVREYNYVYTGKNQDVLRVDIDFDTAYYTQISTYRDQVARGGTNRFGDQGNFADTLQSTDGQSTATVTPQTTEVKGFDARSNSMNTATNPAEKLVGDLKTSLYTKSRGDNLNIKLQITGDPDFIKQDDIYYNPRSLEYSQIIANRSKTPIVNNGPLTGQILFDSEQVYVRLNFLNAVDINDNIGITNKQETLQNGRTTNGSFSGIYKVLTVSNEFNRGQFTQTLDLVRMPDELPKTPEQKSQSVSNAGNKSNSTEDQDALAKKNIFANPTIPAAEPAPTQAALPTETPTQPSQVAQQSTPLTFAQAFRQARRDFGDKPGGSFEWRGKLYQTNYRNEPYVANPTPVYPGN
jgi:hypothetical protein